MNRKRVYETSVDLHAPLPPLKPYKRCQCGKCAECRDNEKWDRVFREKFEVKQQDVRGVYQSAMNDLG
jgi:hypothetical protein